MPPVLFDASVYVAALRSGDDARLQGRRAAEGGPVWLSAVVLEELYAGAVGSSVQSVEGLVRKFHRVGRVLVPNAGDWVQTGRVLARLAAKYDYEVIGRGRLTNDALIAMSAARLGITVITSNVRDFSKIAEFRPFQWRVSSPKASQKS